jgi:ribonuclease T2
MRLALGLAALAIASPAGLASAEPIRACVVPRDLTPAPASPPPAREIVRDAPTASYMLALTWSPEWCRARRGDADAPGQCELNHLGFVVHGLWPNGAGGRHPRYCGPAPVLSPATVRANYCMTPSARLLQHEWAAHGTCGWATPEAYFGKAQALWRQIRTPDLTRAATASDVRRAFVRRNPQIPVDGIYIKVASGNRLEDVRLCYDLNFRPARCQGGFGAPDRARIRITP